MGALAGVTDIVGSQLTLIVSLLIPFVGIVVPAIVILAISAPSRTRHAVTVTPFPAGGVTAASGPAPASTANPPDAPYPPGADIAWACARLHESEIFEGLTDSEIRLVAAIAERRLVMAGERLAHAGGRGDHLFLILNGQFRLLTQGQDEIPVRMAHAGEVVPLAVIIDPPVFVTTLEAITDGEVFAIPRMGLLALFEARPMVGLQVYRAAAKSFERRYRKSLDGLAGALRVAMHPQREDSPAPTESPVPQPRD